MHIHLSTKDGMPIYRQIVNQIKYLAASGQLRPGDELPPIRILAQQLLVTPNTIVKAYGELEAQGLIHKSQRAGTFLSDTQSPLARQEQRRILRDRANALLADARQMGIGYDAVLALLEECRTALEDSGTKQKGKLPCRNP